PRRGLVLHVRDRDRDPPLPLLRGLVDLVERGEVRPPAQRQRLGDRRGQRRLAVVDVPDRPHVHVRLRPLVLPLRHDASLTPEFRIALTHKNRPPGGLPTTEPTSGFEPLTPILPRS